MKTLVIVILLSLVTATQAEQASVVLPGLTSPEEFAAFFRQYVNSSKPVVYDAIGSPRLVSKSSSLPEQAFLQAETFFKNLGPYQDHLAAMDNVQAVEQYAGLYRLQSDLQTTKSWGTFVVGRSLLLIIFRDIKKRILADAISAAEVEALLSKYRMKGSNNNQLVMDVIYAESSQLLEVESRLQQRFKDKMTKEAILTRALWEIDKGPSSMPEVCINLRSGNLGGLLDLEKFVDFYQQMDLVLLRYRNNGGSVAASQVEMKKQYESSREKRLPLSTFEEGVNAELLYDFIHLPSVW